MVIGYHITQNGLLNWKPELHTPFWVSLGIDTLLVDSELDLTAPDYDEAAALERVDRIARRVRVKDEVGRGVRAWLLLPCDNRTQRRVLFPWNAQKAWELYFERVRRLAARCVFHAFAGLAMEAESYVHGGGALPANAWTGGKRVEERADQWDAAVAPLWTGNLVTYADARKHIGYRRFWERVALRARERGARSVMFAQDPYSLDTGDLRGLWNQIRKEQGALPSLGFFTDAWEADGIRHRETVNRLPEAVSLPATHGAWLYDGPRKLLSDPLVRDRVAYWTRKARL